MAARNFLPRCIAFELRIFLLVQIEILLLSLKTLKDPLSTGMLWVDQQYHNAILDCQKQNKLFKTNDWRAPVLHKHKAFDVIQPTQTQALILLSDLYHASLCLSVEFQESSIFEAIQFFCDIWMQFVTANGFRSYCGKDLMGAFVCVCLILATDLKGFVILARGFISQKFERVCFQLTVKNCIVVLLICPKHAGWQWVFKL